MGNRVILKLVVSFVLLIMASVLILNFFVSIKLKDYFETSVSERLKPDATLVGSLLQHKLSAGETDIQQMTDEMSAALGARVTILSDTGKVIGDSTAAPEKLENHSDRPEIISAFTKGQGESTRFSDTLGYKMKYVAVRISTDDGKAAWVVRLALPLSELDTKVKGIYRTVLTGGGVAVVFVIILGYLVSRGIIGPLTQMTGVARAITAGDFSHRLHIKGNDELAVLAASLNRMSDELQEQMLRLKEADRMKTELVANVSHELKTPLTSIMGYIETLQDGALEDDNTADRFLSIIHKNAQSLSNTVSDLLKLSELEYAIRGKAERKEEFDLRTLINETVSVFGYTINQKNQKILTSFEGDNFTMLGDRVKIEQALVNVIDNAVKYTPDDGKISLLVQADEQAIKVTVSDTGMGISQEHMGRVFERFYRVDKARSRKLGGTGLGLAIVKHAVLLHGGSVDIQSNEGQGTSIYLSFPRKA